MAKPRAKTLQERMGFMEDDLTTPGHDAIMLWLDENMEAYLQEWLGIDRWTPTQRQVMKNLSAHWDSYLQWTMAMQDRVHQEFLQTELDPKPEPEPEDHVQAAIRFMNKKSLLQSQWDEERRIAQRTQLESCSTQIEEVLAKKELPLSLPPFPGIKVIKKIWEQPLTTTREYTIGFIDLVVSYRRPSLEYICPHIIAQENQERWYYVGWEGWESWQPSWEISFEKHEVAFEVKTTIPSLGELLRQLKLYEQHFTGRIFVVAPDARFADKIREQGFGFIQTPTNLSIGKPTL